MLFVVKSAILGCTNKCSIMPPSNKTAIKIPGKRIRSTTKEDVAARKKLVRSPISSTNLGSIRLVVNSLFRTVLVDVL